MTDNILATENVRYLEVSLHLFCYYVVLLYFMIYCKLYCLRRQQLFLTTCYFFLSQIQTKHDLKNKCPAVKIDLTRLNVLFSSNRQSYPLVEDRNNIIFIVI